MGVRLSAIKLRFAALAFLSALLSPHIISAAIDQPAPHLVQMEAQNSHSDLPPAAFTLGGRTSSHDSDAFADILIPIIGSADGFFFLDPRASLGESDANEENIGVGYRQLAFDDSAILGINVFYDTRETAHGNRFDQLGLGIEFLTKWIDFRNNWYLTEDEKKLIESREVEEILESTRVTMSAPFFTMNEVRQNETRTTTRTVTQRRFERFEESMDGFDVEVGVLLPALKNCESIETRLFAGYYFYDSNLGDDLDGMMARVEVRALPYLIFDGQWFEDKELHGTNYYAGARAVFPFETEELLKLKNPFKIEEKRKPKKPRVLRDRMTEMVIRDLDIVSETSDFIEDKNAATTTTTTEKKVIPHTLVNDITFVDADNSIGILDAPPAFENGTFEHPFNTIQEGIDNAFGAMRVYVDSSSVILITAPLFENVVMRDGVYLHGSGHRVWGPESGIAPIIDGGSFGPAITLANNNEVDGFIIRNSDFSGPPIMRSVGGNTFDISRFGIYGENKTNFNIHNNTFSGNTNSITLASDPMGDFRSTITANTITGGDTGIGIFSEGAGAGVFSHTITNNTITGPGIGINMQFSDYSDLNVAITGNTVTNTTFGPGITIDAFSTMASTNGGTVQISNNTVTGNNFHNIRAFLEADSSLSLIVNGNTATGAANGHGIFLSGNIFDGNLNAQVNNNDADSNDFGIVMDFESDAGNLTFEISGNEASDALGDGIHVEMLSSTGELNLTVSNNTASANVFEGILALMATDADITAVFSGNSAGGNEGCGLDLLVDNTGTLSDVNVTLTNNIIVGNICDGIALTLGAGGTLNLTGEGNVSRNNTLDGVYLDLQSDTGSYNINFGNATASTAGFNSFFDNGLFEMENFSVDSFTILAENNYWVDPTPDQGEEYEEGAGTIDADPALAANPNPGL